MASGREGGTPLLSTPSAFRTPVSADPRDVRIQYRVCGALLMATGTLYFAIVVGDLLMGKASAATLTAIGAAAQFICGTVLVAQRYLTGPDTVRRSQGILGMAIGTGTLAYSLQYIGDGGTGGTDPVALLARLSLVLGSLLFLISAVSLSSRRYAAWYRRRWEKWVRRRNDRLTQWR